MRQGTTVLPAGTLLHHGTQGDFDCRDIEGPAWFSRSIAVARHFAQRSGDETPRILCYVTTAEIELPLIRGVRGFDAFCEEHDIRPYSADDMADGVRRAGLAGWLIPDNYPDGDDILLVDLSDLSFHNEVN